RRLALEPEDAAVDVGLAQQHGHVVGEVARGEVVGAVDENVVRPGDLQRVLRRERLVVGHHVDVGVDVQHAGLGRLDLQHAHAVRAVDHLPVQVGGVYHVVVHQADFAHAGRGQV